VKQRFSLKNPKTTKISPRQRLERNNSFRKTNSQIATTDWGKSSLLRQLGEGLLKLVLGSVGLLLGYSGYLLAPHLQELIYGHFGRPASRLDRA
jgi:hypothetical protein